MLISERAKQELVFWANLPDGLCSQGQGSAGAGLVSSLNIGCAMEDAFRGSTSTKIGEVEINCEILQDDIANLNDNVN